VAGVRVTGQGVVVLDKCRVAHNSRGLMVSDQARALVRKSRFLSNGHSSLSRLPPPVHASMLGLRASMRLMHAINQDKRRAAGWSGLL
jgi:hypothetical protein